MAEGSKAVRFFPPEQFGVRTDLAVEAREAVGDVPGVEVQEEKRERFTVTRVEVKSPEGEQRLGKPRGRYVTIEAYGLRNRNRALEEEVGAVLAAELGRLLPSDGLAPLVAGLGNWDATPDALGPRVVDQLLVTRHLGHSAPPELRGRLRPVCAIAPGVLGTTGIETAELLAGVVARVRPSMVIAVDALAARSLNRLLTTIQVTDTGIHPGSGVAQGRPGISAQTLGVPVLAIGIPTVVHALTIVGEAIEALSEELSRAAGGEGLMRITPEAKQGLVDRVLGPQVGHLMVTPKEIDAYVGDLARMVAGALNRALQPGVEMEVIGRYVG
ncbi:MAG: GPR endopeptidase [Acetobacteraceae bacterium]|nr:GPR endopeptidase [Acetobacteraceae bacterium]